MQTPNKFNAAIFFNTESSKCCFSSHSLICGATSFCANSRTVCTSARWSSVNSKSIISLLFPIRCSKRPHILPEQTWISRMLCYTRRHAQQETSSRHRHGRPGANELCAGARKEPEKSDRRDQRSGQRRSADRLPAGAFSVAVFLPDRRYSTVQAG